MALRLHWFWQEWGDDPKPWVGTEVPCNDTDHLLINSSTTVTIGNGNKACFWHHNWLEGEAPRYLAPQLFKLVRMKTGWFVKNYTMATGLEHYKCVSPQQYNLKNSLAYGLDYRMFCCRYARYNYLIGNGRLMVPTPPARHTGHNSEAHIESSNMTSFGRQNQRTSARFTNPHACQNPNGKQSKKRG
jgi:hypothetical protein